MPASIEKVPEDGNAAVVLTTAVTDLEATNHRVTYIERVGAEWVIVYERKAGRPPKETR